MNKYFFIIILFSVNIFSIEIYWDLGVGISQHPVNSLNNDINISTYHRLEGLKKYFSMDYEAAIYHFSQLDENDQRIILYEYIDCYYSLDKFDEALNILTNYDNTELSDNIIYLKSKIHFKLHSLAESLIDLNYLLTHHQHSDYNEILKFEIQKINLLKK